MKACTRNGCDVRGDGALGMCTRHSQEHYRTAVLSWHFRGATDRQVADAREGANTACVDCGDAPIGGGLRCVRCFTRCALARRAHAKQVRLRAAREPEPRLRPHGTPAAYQRHYRKGERPCETCRRWKAREGADRAEDGYWRDRRRKAAS